MSHLILQEANRYYQGPWDVRTGKSLYPECERWAFGLSKAWRNTRLEDTPEEVYSGKKH